jgi:hypothetical protein
MDEIDIANEENETREVTGTTTQPLTTQPFIKEIFIDDSPL